MPNRFVTFAAVSILTFACSGLLYFHHDVLTRKFGYPVSDRERRAIDFAEYSTDALRRLSAMLSLSDDGNKKDAGDACCNWTANELALRAALEFGRHESYSKYPEGRALLSARTFAGGLALDRTFVINLDRRVDRWDETQEALRGADMTSGVERFSALAGSVSDMPLYPRMGEWLGKDRTTARVLAAIGCLKSHVEVCRLALSRGYERVLILEDDVMFYEERRQVVKETLARALASSPPGWLMVFLGGNLVSCPKATNDGAEGVARVTNLLSAVAYVINEEGMRRVVKDAFSYGREIDGYYRDVLQPAGRTFCTVPQLATQRDGYSDIMFGDVHYAWMRKPIERRCPGLPGGGG
jgi:hypothetical protein